MIEYEFGQGVRLTAAFQDANGNAADPTTVTFRYALVTQVPPPDPTATSAAFGGGAVVKDSVGNYHLDISGLAEGNYIYTVTGTGTVAAASRGRFRVLPSPFA